jgi:hypothetical protein
MSVKSKMLSEYYFIGDMLTSSSSMRLTDSQRENWNRMRHTLYLGHKYLSLLQEMRDIAIINSGHLSNEVSRLNLLLQRAVSETSSI